MNNNTVISISNLTKEFSGKKAVDEISLEIKRGEIFGFLGPNGAGKSTTIRMLCGILKPTSGKGDILGLDIYTQAEEIKKNIGYMSQHFGLYNDLTVEENISFYSRIYLRDKKLAVKKSLEIIEASGLSPYRKYLASNLSGGWKQRLALACSVVHEPKILFLDEPTAGIDPVSRRIIWDLLYDLANRGMTLFVTTHYMEEAERCTRIGFINNGRLVACDTPKGIKSQFMPLEILSLKTLELKKAFDLLNGREFLKDINIYGDEIHITTENSERYIPVIKGILNENHIQLEKIEKIYPSIEDVFVYLTKSGKRT
ncbi:MAG: hypothetical protein A3C43_09785 [Candidatus Schekmanbacteria bacterium RIFCSPHIGHO2_02_FULL_38_11]|uniref:ABC transporter domain-containing protein n=1 Tax=Candidatus Schekmanbacteria bacterium RIFCSPLOWO2_12_FULL_38_15 TaxID=1817883 RepID=A0A1F7SIH6_9BACT|nr:MAG: hypothetical protein A2043_04665 [Candidatus Schekmanbacteria bacterium GWA2_38_9]OGL49675.1 MAG: hypothetical protein A3H37_01410 [Candidatus Schekmanbacteria bacterium RIFCSPLOWO2_02_FULL_38_14]OGL51917.1 MAG: hypothetical protein A3C43_09785 [Candidatus Schekmanbacteria bacterium RIFCSPHIGHO2_02_FULL_38_11]OGL53028.1 MAG: hypothetical protein A3G31_08965 [Candidatus Schekmanbacteria bacterium RIFCSPLOWO2_12_FULL_38_15]